MFIPYLTSLQRPHEAVRLGDHPDVLDEMENPRVQVAIWVPPWDRTSRKALVKGGVARFFGLPAQTPWYYDDSQDPLSLTCNTPPDQNKSFADLWKQGLPVGSVYNEIAEKAATLTQAFIRHAAPSELELMSSADMHKSRHRPHVRMRSHLDEGVMKGFGNVAGITTPCLLTQPQSAEARRDQLPMHAHRSRVYALPPHSFALWRGSNSDNPFHHDFPFSAKSRFRHTLQILDPNF